MFKNILIPTDGSRLAARGVKAGIRLARALGARVTAVYVVPPYVPMLYGESTVYVPGYSPAEYRRITERQAKKVLGAVAAAARGAGVRCAARFVTEHQPWRAILATVKRARCDAVAMASHGRGGLGGLILGSETQRVLAQSRIPVLVVR